MAIAGPTAATGTVTTAAQTVSVACAQFDRVNCQITGSLATFSIAFEASVDSGTTWVAVGVVAAGGASATTWVTTTAANGNFIFDCTAWTNFRIRLVSVTSGSGTILLQPAIIGFG